MLKEEASAPLTVRMLRLRARCGRIWVVERLPNCLCQGCHLLFGQRENPSAQVKNGRLLLLIGDTRRQRRHMPMHMAIALLASQGHNVDPLGRNHVSDGLSHLIDELLE